MVAQVDGLLRAHVPSIEDYARLFAVIGGKMKRSGGGHVSLLGETFATEDRTALRRLERDGGFFAALGAGSARFHPGKVVRITRGLRGGKNRDPLGLAGLAAFGLVFELLVVEKQLFSGGEDELSAAVDAGQYSILKLH